MIQRKERIDMMLENGQRVSENYQTTEVYENKNENVYQNHNPM